MLKTAICRGGVLPLPCSQPKQRHSLTKILLVMKLTFVLLTVAFLSVNAKSFSQNVSFSGKNVVLEKVFNAIEKQTGYSFLYTEKIINAAKPVSIDASNVPLEQFLQDVFKDQPIGFEINNKSILLFNNPPKPAITMALEPYMPPGNVHGIVVNDKQTPVPGVTIVYKKAGQVLVYISDEKGEFNINRIDDGDSLVFSAVSYETKYVQANTHTYMRIAMKTSVTDLQAITVSYNTGFQLINKERATGAFDKPDMAVFSKRTNSMDVMARLEGLVPGVQISPDGANSYNLNTNGTAARTRKTIIRGFSSIESEVQPLYVVNNVVVPDFSVVNPDDIQDITVLKDAAAAAIWGARSANGVIVVTTKSGANKFSRLSVSYSGFVNYTGKPDFNRVPMLNSRQYIDLAKKLFDPNLYPYEAQYFLAPHDRIMYDQYLGRISSAEANRQLDSLASINNSSQILDLWYRPAISTNHTVSLSGGNSIYSFYASLGYNGNQSPIPGERSNSYRLSLNQNINAGDRIRLSLSTTMINTVGSGRNPVSTDNSFLPYQLFQDKSGNSVNMRYMNGNLDSISQDYATRSGINMDYYPLNEMNYANSTNNTLSLNVTANLSVKIVKGLVFMGTYGYQKTPTTNTNYNDHQQLEQRMQAVSLTEEGNPPIYNYPLTGGLYTTGNTEQRDWTVRNQLAYEGNLRNGKDRISLQVGQDVQQGYQYGSSTTIIGYDPVLNTYPYMDYQRLRNGIFPTVTGFGILYFDPVRISKSTTRSLGYFGLASYSMDGKYNVDVSVRQDYSNQFASEVSSQNKPVWSFGARWSISKEKFMQPVSWLNDLGLRATYGITGNSPHVGLSSQYDIVTGVGPSNSINYTVIAGDALNLTGPANKTLTWEYTRNLNIGLDYAVLNRRINGGINVYRRVTTNLIGNVPPNPISWNSVIKGNLGKMTNTGIEISIQSQNVRTKDFSWTTSFTMGMNKNKLEAYSKPSGAISTLTTRLIGSREIGYPVNPVWAYHFAGLDNMGDPQIYLANGNKTKAPNVATGNDLVFMGSSTPKCSGGLSNTFSYKDFSLALNMIYNLGAVMRRNTPSFFSGKLGGSGAFTGMNIPAFYIQDQWQKPGDEAFTNVPSYVANQSVASARRNTGYFSSGDLNVISSSYIKLRDITLNYSLHQGLLDRLKVKGGSVFVQTNNFLVWANNKYGIDPEFGGIAPYTKHSYSMGVNLSF